MRYVTGHLTCLVHGDIISGGRRGFSLLSQIVPLCHSDGRVPPRGSHPAPRADSRGGTHPPPVAGARDLWNVTAPHATC
ncbi:unnamed protein product [Arctia plantaginis]|uniref:Uncharacterized protein n=1 Tax=Arctia plantaginis TaxID=874455 RepID=A0A8S0YS80_ARCPL|nr:unnamed protein product [Arctia plantaginis]